MLEQNKKMEVDFFDQKAQSNDRGYSMLDSRGYQRVVGEFQRYLAPNKNLKVLDVGCGRGAYSEDRILFRKNLRILKGKVA